MITERPGASNNTIDAAARAASVAPETAIPQSAFFRAGASLTPSPGHADDVTALLQRLDDEVLVLGKNLCETIRLFN